MHTYTSLRYKYSEPQQFLTNSYATAYPTAIVLFIKAATFVHHWASLKGKVNTMRETFHINDEH
jgi:hypothetical protein